MTNENINDIRIVIVVPTYNESKNIPILVKQIKRNIKNIDKVYFTLLIVDDNSPDGTGFLADKLVVTEKLKEFQVKVLHRKKKNGLGAAYIEAFSKMLKKNYDYILQMDADLSHDPIYIQKFVDEVHKGMDLVVASRYISGGGTPDWGLIRKILSKGGNLYTTFFLKGKINDYTGGFNLYSTRLLKQLDLRNITATGYGFQIELKYNAQQHTKHISQIPIIFKDRQHGNSKIPKSTLVDNLLLVLKLKFLKNQQK